MDISFSSAHFSVFIIIIITAYIFRGITGFGSGLIAIPLLALFTPLHFVVPFVSFLDLTASVIHGIKHRSEIAWPVIIRALPFTIIGVLSALYLFNTLNTALLVNALGIFVILFAIYSLISPELKQQPTTAWAFFAGGLGGFIGTLFGTGGPFYVIYFHLAKLNKGVFRATCAATFLIDGLFRFTGYAFSGFFNTAMFNTLLIAFPVMLVAMQIGAHIHTNISQRTFQRGVALLLLVSGVALLIKN